MLVWLSFLYGIVIFLVLILTYSVPHSWDIILSAVVDGGRRWHCLVILWCRTSWHPEPDHIPASCQRYCGHILQTATHSLRCWISSHRCELILYSWACQRSRDYSSPELVTSPKSKNPNPTTQPKIDTPKPWTRICLGRIVLLPMKSFDHSLDRAKL